MFEESLHSILKEIITRPYGGKQKTKVLTAPEDNILMIIKNASFLLQSEPAILNLSGNFVVVGDVHGNISSILRIIEKIGYPSEDTKYILLGDYIDRGFYSLEVVLYLYILKLLFPSYIYLLRGNHETRSIGLNFKNECIEKYSLKVFDEAMDSFNNLPMAAILNDSIFCVHGGISSRVKSRKELMNIKKTDGDPRSDDVITDFLWSDPSTKFSGYSPSKRGVGRCYGEDAVDQFLSNCQLETVVRGHEVAELGYDTPFNNNTLITVFSSVNYCGQKNTAAVLIVDEDNQLSYEFFRPLSVKDKLKFTLPEFILEKEVFKTDYSSQEHVDLIDNGELIKNALLSIY